MAFARALEETSRRERESSTRPALLLRVALAGAWLLFALSQWLFGGWPSVAATAPVAGAYAALSVLGAVFLWRSGARLRSWIALPLLDAPAVGLIVWWMLPLAANPAGMAATALGVFFVLLIAAQRSLSQSIIWWVAGISALCEGALLWRAGLPLALPATAILLGLGAWPLQRSPTRLRSLRERLVQEHASLQRFGRFYTPMVAHRELPEDPGASHDDCPVTLVYVELHHPGGDGNPFKTSAEMEEAITAFDDAIAPLILRHGGTPDRSAGAGLMIYFLRHAVLGDDGSRGVRCALEMAAALSSLNHRREQAGQPPLAVGLGIHASWAAIDRSQGPAEMVALGNSVGIAAELAVQSWASRTPVLASPETRVRAASGFIWAEVGPNAYVVGLEPAARPSGLVARLSG
ncbi:MAG TPA: hypothetical protein VIG99_24190 [Myxococcaceae bacterium]